VEAIAPPYTRGGNGDDRRCRPSRDFLVCGLWGKKQDRLQTASLLNDIVQTPNEIVCRRRFPHVCRGEV